MARTWPRSSAPIRTSVIAATLVIGIVCYQEIQISILSSEVKELERGRASQQRLDSRQAEVNDLEVRLIKKLMGW